MQSTAWMLIVLKRVRCEQEGGICGNLNKMSWHTRMLCFQFSAELESIREQSKFSTMRTSYFLLCTEKRQMIGSLAGAAFTVNGRKYGILGRQCESYIFASNILFHSLN